MTIELFHARARKLRKRTRAQAWRLLHPRVEVHSGVRVGQGCRLILDPGASLILGEGCEIDDATTIAAYAEARVSLGAGVFVGHRCTIAARSSIEIGPGTFLAELVSVRDHDHAVGLPPSSGKVTVDPVVVGADVWIGAKVTVVRGVRIGDGAVIGANAVVRGEVPPRCVAAGVPARVIRHLDSP